MKVILNENQLVNTLLSNKYIIKEYTISINDIVSEIDDIVSEERERIRINRTPISPTPHERANFVSNNILPHQKLAYYLTFGVNGDRDKRLRLVSDTFPSLKKTQKNVSFYFDKQLNVSGTVVDGTVRVSDHEIRVATYANHGMNKDFGVSIVLGRESEEKTITKGRRNVHVFQYVNKNIENQRLMDLLIRGLVDDLLTSNVFIVDDRFKEIVDDFKVQDYFIVQSGYIKNGIVKCFVVKDGYAIKEIKCRIVRNSIFQPLDEDDLDFGHYTCYFKGKDGLQRKGGNFDWKI